MEGSRSGSNLGKRLGLYFFTRWRWSAVAARKINLSDEHRFWILLRVSPWELKFLFCLKFSWKLKLLGKLFFCYCLSQLPHRSPETNLSITICNWIKYLDFPNKKICIATFSLSRSLSFFKQVNQHSPARPEGVHSPPPRAHRWQLLSSFQGHSSTWLSVWVRN